MALLIVMVVVMLIALAAYSFNQQMTDAYRLGTLQSERTQARLAFTSGIEYGLVMAERPRSERAKLLGAEQQSFLRIPVDEIQSGATISNSLGDWTFSLLRPNANDEGSLGVKAGWVDESAKLNVWMLLQQEKSHPGHARNALLNLPGASPEIVDSFLSANQLTSGRSSSLQERIESRTQQQQPEQQLAHQWTGGDWDHSYAIEPFERSLGRQQTSLENERVTAWRDLLTFNSGCRNESIAGKPRIFLNDKNLARLYSRLRNVWDDQRAAFVIAVRQFGLSGSVEPVSSGSGSVEPATTESGVAWTPDFSIEAKFSIASQLDLVDASVQVPQAGESPMTLASPFSRDAPIFSQYLEGLLDDVTLTLEAFLSGQINVNLAPSPVLLGIPGISSGTVEEILRKRTESSEAPRDSLAWLITEEVLEISQLKPLLPWITAGGDCFSTQVVVYRDELSPAYRGTVVLDARRRPAVAMNIQLWHPWSRLSLAALSSSGSSGSSGSPPNLTSTLP